MFGKWLNFIPFLSFRVLLLHSYFNLLNSSYDSHWTLYPNWLNIFWKVKGLFPLLRQRLVEGDSQFTIEWVNLPKQDWKFQAEPEVDSIQMIINLIQTIFSSLLLFAGNVFVLCVFTYPLFYEMPLYMLYIYQFLSFMDAEYQIDIHEQRAVWTHQTHSQKLIYAKLRLG